MHGYLIDYSTVPSKQHLTRLKPGKVTGEPNGTVPANRAPRFSPRLRAAIERALTAAQSDGFDRLVVRYKHSGRYWVIHDYQPVVTRTELAGKIYIIAASGHICATMLTPWLQHNWD